MALPNPIHDQDFLLTLDTSKLPLVKNALPGVHIWPLFLDAENGEILARNKSRRRRTEHTGKRRSSLEDQKRPCQIRTVPEQCRADPSQPRRRLLTHSNRRES